MRVWLAVAVVGGALWIALGLATVALLDVAKYLYSEEAGS